jgi:hypothetical protein
MALSLSTTLRNSRLDAITTAIGGSALLRIYSGTPPLNVGTALSGNTQLAELTCNATFAPAASAGVLTLNAITQDSSADATGTASFFRILTSGGTAIVQGTVGTSNADLNLNAVALSSGAAVSVSSFTITEANT